MKIASIFHQQSSEFIKSNKILILIFIDLMICVFSIWVAMCLHFDYLYSPSKLPPFLIIISMFMLILVFFGFDIYKNINRFSGFDTFIQLSKALLIYNLFFFIFITFFEIEEVHRSIGILHPIIITLLIISLRAFIRVLFKYTSKDKHSQNVLIYGAGEAGRQLASIINFSKKYHLSGFLEDNHELINNKINNKIIYNSKQLHDLKNKLGIDLVLMAMPSLNNKQKSSIIKKIQLNKINVKTLPTLSELESSNISLSDLRPLNINELLGRPEINTRNKKRSEYILNQTILITGGGGSIGAELCKQIFEQSPSKIIIIDSNEYNLYTISNFLTDAIKLSKISITLIPILSSIQDRNSLEKIIKKHKPSIIYHAAAYKHLHLVEINPIEGIKNNIFGTLNLVKLAIKYKCPKFILISTDKAVRPTNIMGATKRFCELILQAFDENSKNTNFTIVRFGNVLASSGSVVPRFSEQISNGGPITLTHRRVSRYFMTIQEAVHLVIEAGGMSLGGEVFILKMGKPVLIYDLAKTMIFLSGKTLKNKNNPKGDIEIEVTGLRKGEKLYEEVLIGENPEKTENKMILKANEHFFNKQILNEKILQLEKFIKNEDLPNIKYLFSKIILGYKITSK